MTDHVSIKWLNSACLGSTGTRKPVSMKHAAEKMIETFESLHGWITEWIGCEKSHIAFVDSTSAACDAVISALDFDCERYIYTSSAHPTIRRSIHSAVHACRRLQRRTPV